jgi:hypothetical protein
LGIVGSLRAHRARIDVFDAREIAPRDVEPLGICFGTKRSELVVEIVDAGGRCLDRIETPRFVEVAGRERIETRVADRPLELGPRRRRCERDRRDRDKATPDVQSTVRNAPESVIVALVEVQVRAVLSFVQDLARLGEHGGRQFYRAVDGALVGQKFRLAPVFPRLERFAVDLGRKPNAEPLLEMEPDDEHLRPAREVGPVFPERPIGCLVFLPDA